LKSKLVGFACILAALALPASAAGRPSTISGFVRNSAGTGQMGVVVQLLGTRTAVALTVFTDDHGFFSANGLLPGVYQVKVSAPSFLPSLFENVNLRSGTQRILNVTLNTLWEAMLSMPRRQAQTDDDDWKWTLRSAANRPILRMRDGAPLVVVSDTAAKGSPIKTSVAFVAGATSDGFSGGSNDMRTVFSVERSLFSSGTLSFNGNVGYGGGSPATVLRTAYAHQMANGSRPQVAFTVHRFALPDGVLHNAALQALSLSTSDNFVIGSALEINVGSELQSIQFMGHATTARPFGSVDLHLSPNTTLEYRYATSRPDARLAKGYDSAPADMTEAEPRMTISAFAPAVERSRHQEVSVSRRVNDTSVQLAMYSDHVTNTALTGVGDASAQFGDVLPDVYSGTFSYRGAALNTNGLRLVVQQKLPSDLTATLAYGYGGVLDAPANLRWDELDPALHNVRRHALTAKLSGRLPGTRTLWTTSYKWTSAHALTPVDMFNTSAGQSEPFFNVFVRQPIPGASAMGRMEALLEVRNLLAQGYLPLVSQDGQILYLVQSSRSIRGGVGFTF
jgi:hypothetical protein